MQSGVTKQLRMLSQIAKGFCNLIPSTVSLLSLNKLSSEFPRFATLSACHRDLIVSFCF